MKFFIIDSFVSVDVTAAVCSVDQAMNSVKMGILDSALASAFSSMQPATVFSITGGSGLDCSTEKPLNSSVAAVDVADLGLCFVFYYSGKVDPILMCDYFFLFFSPSIGKC